MARIPTRDSLSQAVPRASGGIVQAPRDFIGDALVKTGVALSAQAEEDKKKQNVMEKARATAFLQESLINGRAQYTLQNKPDVAKWGDDFAKGSESWKQAAAKHISDPRERELFLLQSSDDVARYNFNVSSEAQKIQNDRQIESTKLAMERIIDLAASTDDDEERIGLLAKYRELGKGLVDSNLVTPEWMADNDIKARQKVAGLVVQKTIQTSPGVAYGALTGRPTESYVNRLFAKENARRDPKARPRDKDGNLLSSALGYFQFTHDTWERLRRQYPELGLTQSFNMQDNDLDGRLDAGQQMRAMGKLTEENAAGLRKAGFTVTEANLYLAHFAGLEGAKKLLTADPTAPADKTFPDMAKGNKRHFVGKTVAEAINSLTNGFNHQPVKVGPEYASLSAEQRIALTSQAEKAASAEWAQGKDEWETDLLVSVSDEAMQMGTREEALAYVAGSEVSSEVRLKAEQLVNSRWNQRDKVEEENKKQEFDTAFSEVQQAIESGDQGKAMRLASAVKDPSNRDTLRKYVMDPPTAMTIDMQQKLDSLRFNTDPAKQKEFMDINFGSMEYVRAIPPDKLKELSEFQRAMKERAAPTGKDPVMTTVAQMRDNLANSMGLVLSGKDADAEDIAVMDLMMRDVQQDLEAAYQAKGAELTSSEMQAIADNAVVKWYEKGKIDDGFFNFDTSGPAARLVSEAYEDYKNSGKTLPLPQLRTQFDLAIAAAERRDNKRYSKTPATFAAWLLAESQKD